ncbi:MAG: hypothetical protein JSS14_21910 [Proteobacteria bacterium]|nr:hypothetical protein [Pseudomonadota bacterium]
MNLVDALAELCHEVNRAYCEALGDTSQKPWADAPDWQKLSASKGVAAHLTSNLTPEQSHSLWMEEKRRTGWKYGEVKDEVAKTHPCFVPYEQLPAEQKVKDYLFRAVVRTIQNQTGR